MENEIKETISYATLAATTATEPVALDRATRGSIQITWSNGSAGTAALSAQVQVSNNKVNWVNEGTAASIDDTDGTAIVEIVDCLWQWIRVNITRTTGDADVEIVKYFNR